MVISWRFKILAMAVLAASVCLFHPRRAEAKMTVEYMDFKASDQGIEYRIAVIKDTNFQHSTFYQGARGPEEARKLAERARDWSYSQFAQYYPDYSAAEFEELKKHDILEDPRSVRVIVMKTDGSGDIVGSLKFVYDDLHTPLPYEAEFPLTRPKHGFREFFEYDSSTWGLKSSLQLTGQVVQVMEFVIDKNARGDLNAVLHFASELDFSFYTMRMLTEDVPKSQQPKEVRAQRARESAWGGAPTRFIVHPEDYILYCDARLVPYYASLGFEDVQTKGKLHGMKISREKYARISMQSPFFRRAYNKLDHMGLTIDWSTPGSSLRPTYYPPGADSERHGESSKTKTEKLGVVIRAAFCKSLFDGSEATWEVPP
jgi:hypothetical protein